MNSKEKTSVTVFREDLKWLKKRKIDQDAKTLAEAFHNVREELEGEK